MSDMIMTLELAKSEAQRCANETGLAQVIYLTSQGGWQGYKYMDKVTYAISHLRGSAGMQVVLITPSREEAK